MGLSVSPAIWQELIDYVFESIPNKERYKIIVGDAMV